MKGLWSVTALVSLMIFLASFFTVLAVDAQLVLSTWRGGLEGAITVMIPPNFDRSDQDLAQVTQSALKIIKKTPAVSSVQILSVTEVQEMMSQWINDDDNTLNIALPIMIDVRVAKGSDRTQIAQEFQRQLSGLQQDLVVEAHTQWQDSLVVSIRGVQVIVVAIAVLVFLATLVVVMLVTSQNLDRDMKVVEVMHLVGAHDRYIAKQFASKAVFVTSVGSFFGGSIACFILWISSFLVSGFFAIDVSFNTLSFQRTILSVVIVCVMMVLTARTVAIRLVLKRLREQESWMK